MNSRLPGMLIALAIASAAHGADGRFGGNAALSPKTEQTSADQRYTLAASLTPITAAKTLDPGIRFQLEAKLASTVAGTACAPKDDVIFRNGFDQGT